MVILDVSAVNVALRTASADLGIAQADIGWTITSYSLIFGSLLLFGGRAADLLGRQRVFLAGLGVFAASSLMTALAGDATILFAARAGQGLGLAISSPAALSIITTILHGPSAPRRWASGARRRRRRSHRRPPGRRAHRARRLAGDSSSTCHRRPLASGAMHIIPADTARPRWRGLELAARSSPPPASAPWSMPSRRPRPPAASMQTLGIGAAAIAGLAMFAALELRTRQPLLRVQRPPIARSAAAL